MRIDLLTREYPPEVYGGAGVHVEYLSRALARRMEVEVRAFGPGPDADGNPRVRFYPEWPESRHGTDPRFGPAVDALARSLHMAKDTLDADLVHCHTWYTDIGGILAAQLWGIPSVLTIHSLEPLRPWKVEQLGRATAKVHCASDEDSDQSLVSFQVEEAISESLEGRRRALSATLRPHGRCSSRRQGNG